MLEAVNRDHRSLENRTTELLATTLVANPELAARLLTRVGLRSASSIEARTMVWTGDGLQNVDMELLAIDRDGHVVARMWSEHKVDSGLGPTQAEDYATALARAHPDAKLAVIVAEENERKRAEASGFPGLAWQEIGDWADELGRAWEGPRWREKALEPSQAGKWRVLDEFLWHLDEEVAVSSPPLDATLVHAWKDAERAEESILGLLERTSRLLDPFGAEMSKNEDVLAIVIESPNGVWGDQAEAYLLLIAQDDDDWAREPKEGPAFGAGIAMDVRAYDALRNQTDWKRSLYTQGFGFCDTEDELWCLRSLAMAELASKDQSAAAQASQLATWAREALEAISQLEPGPFDMPPRGRRAKVAATVVAENVGDDAA